MRRLSEEAKYTMDAEREDYGSNYSADVEVTAWNPNSKQNQVCDIGMLNKESLYKFLRSRGGDNELAEDIVAKTLGWEPGREHD